MTTTMIAATGFGGPELLATLTEDLPEPGPSEVTVAVRAAAVNPIDYKLYSGMFGADPARLPIRLGLEGSGVVTAVGAGASGPAGPVQVGDEVIAWGAGAGGLYATAVTVPGAAILPKPEALSWEKAAGLMVSGGTAVHLLSAVAVSEGDLVLIHGAAGSVGRAAAQLAIGRGARVIGTAAAGRHEELRGYGVEPVTYGPGLADRVRALAPDGVTSALDTVGTNEAVDVSLELVADRHRIATIVAYGRAADGIQVLGGGPGADPGTEIRQAAWRELLPLAASGALDVTVARTYPLAQATDAHRFVIEGHAGGKVVLLP